jgi:hypothetical protein
MIEIIFVWLATHLRFYIGTIVIIKNDYTSIAAELGVSTSTVLRAGLFSRI